jgi:MFS superfamily sulfate permease-like transporter
MSEDGDLNNTSTSPGNNVPPSDHIVVEEGFEPLQRKISESSLIAGEHTPLSTLMDSLKFIIRRDSKRSLYNENPPSPWTYGPTPMVSSPHISNFPDLIKRREEQIRKHEDDKKEAKMMLRDERRRERSTSLGEDPESKESFIQVYTEDEQWERKRKQKLRRVLEHSSSVSLDHSVASTATKYSPTQDMLDDLKREFDKTTNPPGVSIMYGMVNAVIVLPVIMSFGNIIYHDEFFRPYLPVLVKMTVVSGIVHQLCFSTLSTLPFAVGSVQDAGLIFLSTIATSIVRYCQALGCSDEEILATTCVGLSIFTACLGVGLIIIGKLRLAQYVQKLPTPVVGGYLAFIGFFCGQSALSLLSGIQVSNPLEWYKFMHYKPLMLMAPGVIGGCGIYVTVRKIRHMAVLPVSITLIMISFYALLHFSGLTLEDAKDIGLMSGADAPPAWNHTWDFIKFDKVVWAALPGQTLTVCSMIFVVALSSSLDIAAIDLEVPKPLAYDYELKMIGLSNLISGLTGGYTGSYIFSQSIFSLRAGIRSRLAGYVAAFLQAATVVMPLSILSFVPNFIFASLLIMICVDLMTEWLWDVREKLTTSEYVVALMTFTFIQALGVQYGILAGLAFHVIIGKLGFNDTSSKPAHETVSSETSPMILEYDKDDYDSMNDYVFGITLEEPLK